MILTRVNEVGKIQSYSVCDRCGRWRQSKYDRPLCRDCKSVLTYEEQLLWGDPHPVAGRKRRRKEPDDDADE